MEDMHQSEDNHLIPMTSMSAGKGREVAPDVFYYTNQIVNVIFVGEPFGPWVMIDAGMPLSGPTLVEVAEQRFGKDNPPSAIILTHGHFDHIGGIVHLTETWPGVPVYAHLFEFPFLTGELDYPKPDPGVEGGGMLAKISFIYPHKAIDIKHVLQPLPADYSVPYLDGWEWLHTPGHSPGHTSFYRDSDQLLIAGDAFVTVEADAMYNVLVQKEEVKGPPVYLTTNWDAARESVQLLARLDPQIAITGHG